MSIQRVSICVSVDPDDFQRHAAEALERYLRLLFGVRAHIASEPSADANHHFILGLASAPHVRRACDRMPSLSEQGHVVRRVSPDTMVLAGGSAPAVA